MRRHEARRGSPAASSPRSPRRRAAGFLLTACGPRRLHEIPKDRLRAALADMERDYSATLRQGRDRRRHAGHPRRRCSPTRSTSRAASAAAAASTRASRRTTSRATRRCSGSACSQMDKEKGVDFSHADPYYEPAEVPRGGPLLRAGRVPAVPQRALHEGLPDRRHLDRAGRHRRHRLRLVHRLPLLHGRLPVRRAPLQLGRRRRSRRTSSTRTRTYLGNRPRPKGVVEKCTFCIQRTRAGRYPACVEVCPVGARKFGNLLDPDSEIRYIIEHKRVLVLKEELNTDAEVLLLLRAREAQP